MTSDRICEKKGVGLPGGDIKQVSFTTVQACKEECAKTEGCVAFTTVAGTYNQSLQCLLKHKNHGVESAHAIATSVRMSCYEGNLAGPECAGPQRDPRAGVASTIPLFQDPIICFILNVTLNYDLRSNM